MPDAITVERATDVLFLARQDDVLVGRARIAIGDGVWEAFSTVVDPGYQGHGVGAHLARSVLDAAAEAGVTVIPSCWFIEGYLNRHLDRYGTLRDGHTVEATGGAPSCRVGPSVVGSAL